MMTTLSRRFAPRATLPRAAFHSWWRLSRASGHSGAEGDASPNNTGAHPGERSVNGLPPGDYEGFVREHERTILNYLWRMLGEEQTAYDLTQEVFVRAWQRYERVRAYDRPVAWLFRVATNLALDHIARRKVARIHDAGPLTTDSDAEPSRSDPAWRLAERDLVRAALDQLAPRARSALVLREVYGLTTDEIAHALGVSGPAARMTLSRAREQFRMIYLREGGEPRGA